MSEENRLHIICSFLARTPLFEVAIDPLHVGQIVAPRVERSVAYIERGCFNRRLGDFSKEVKGHEVCELEILVVAALDAPRVTYVKRIQISCFVFSRGQALLLLLAFSIVSQH